MYIRPYNAYAVSAVFIITQNAFCCKHFQYFSPQVCRLPGFCAGLYAVLLYKTRRPVLVKEHKKEFFKFFKI